MPKDQSKPPECKVHLHVQMDETTETFDWTMEDMSTKESMIIRGMSPQYFLKVMEYLDKVRDSTLSWMEDQRDRK